MSEANNSIEKIQFVASSEIKNTSESPATSQEIKIQNNSDRDKEIDWHKLAHKLREHNRKLLKKVFQLEQEIIESNKALEEHIKRSRSNDVYVAKQAETINEYQEEIAKLVQKNNTYQQEKSRQSFLIDNLQKKLNASEENVVDLEQKCERVQKAKDLQYHQLLAKEQEIQELNTRFNRQQQHLLQYKAHKNDRVASQPIKAWSADIPRKTPAKTVVSPKINPNDWSASATAKKQAPINSIAAIQLPQFPRKADNEYP